MKNLVLGALLAVASLTAACTSSTNTGDDDGGGSGDNRVSVTVNWSFKHLADMTARSCPTGFGTAVIKAQAVDATSHRGTGTDYTDLYNCSDMSGVSKLPPGHQYLVWVEFTNDAQTSSYASSDSTFVDTTTSVDPITVEIFDDGGFFYLTWDLKDPSGALLTCAEAGITSSGSVETIATSVATPSYFRNDKFTCEDHYGTTDPLLADDYTISVDAEKTDGSGALDVKNLTGTIHPMNGVTDLGNVVLTIDN